MPGHWEGELNNGAGNKSVLGKVARARGMTAVAESVGVGREAMYKALRPGASPRFDTIARVCKALGVRLVALPTKGPVGPGP
ncbi:MAG: hypothetical protein AMXMBFR78_08060 [Rubrivivax sp.]|nr:putative addiction module antidote protein [Rubrivivax sp.]